MANIAAAGGGNPFDVTTRVTISPKYKCIIRPAQSGKTRTMQEMMLQYEKMAHFFHPDDVCGFINIVICSKNLNLVKQTHARMAEIVAPSDDDDSDSGSADATIDGEIFSWMTGTKDTNISPDALAMKIALGDVRMVVCCAHKKRMQYVADLLAIFDRAAFVSRRVNVWMDEADDYVNLWSEVDLARFKKVGDVYLVSATIDDIVEKHTRIEVKAFATTHPPCYRKMADSTIRIVDADTRDAVKYFEAVYTANRTDLCVPGMRLFAPGSDIVASHNAIADFLVAQGFAVAIINGRRKHILVPGMEEPLLIVKHVAPGEIMEIGKVIAKMYNDYDLKRFPFAITGKLCLGRGITFQCEEVQTSVVVDADGEMSSVTEVDYDFLFDAGVIPHMNKPSTLYQCAARMNGNTGEFVNYAPPTVYTTTSNCAAILKSEKIATNLAVLVHTHKLADIGREEMDWAAHGDEERYRREVDAREERRQAITQKSISHLVECDSMKAVHARWAQILSEAGATSDSTPRQPNRREGTYICSLGGKSDKQSAMAIRKKFDGPSTANWGSGLTTAAVGKHICHVYAGYEDDGRIVFFLRWTKKA
jgi:hypothetical protein